MGSRLTEADRDPALRASLHMCESLTGDPRGRSGVHEEGAMGGEPERRLHTAPLHEAVCRPAKGLRCLQGHSKDTEAAQGEYL